MKDAEKENSVAEPVVAPVQPPVDEVTQPNSVTENVACAKVGEFVSF